MFEELGRGCGAIPGPTGRETRGGRAPEHPHGLGKLGNPLSLSPSLSRPPARPCLTLTLSGPRRNLEQRAQPLAAAGRAARGPGPPGRARASQGAIAMRVLLDRLCCGPFCAWRAPRPPGGEGTRARWGGRLGLAPAGGGGGPPLLRLLSLSWSPARPPARPPARSPAAAAAGPPAPGGVGRASAERGTAEAATLGGRAGLGGAAGWSRMEDGAVLDGQHRRCLQLRGCVPTRFPAWPGGGRPAQARLVAPSGAGGEGVRGSADGWLAAQAPASAASCRCSPSSCCSCGRS